MCMAPYLLVAYQNCCIETWCYWENRCSICLSFPSGPSRIWSNMGQWHMTLQRRRLTRALQRPALQRAVELATIVYAVDAVAMLVLLLACAVCLGAHYASGGKGPKPRSCIVWNLLFPMLASSFCLTALLCIVYVAVQPACSPAVQDRFLDSWEGQNVFLSGPDAKSVVRECFGSSGSGSLISLPSIRKGIDEAYSNLAVARHSEATPRLPYNAAAER